MNARADLHVHSRFSDRPSEWLLRRLGAAESYTEPRLVYDLCRRRGMQYVTITDHDTIRGALEIAHLPATFLSVEITAAFPEDGVQVHVLVYGLGEEQFAEIDRLRHDLYALRDYLLDEGLVHSVAHPLFRVDGRLTAEHLERLLLLFETFEGLNGSREPRAGVVLRAILDNLNPELMYRLQERHGIDPRHPAPWRKLLTAGSDDHAGLYVASAYTETPAAGTVAEYLGHLAAGRQRIAGETGSSLKLGRSFFALARRYREESWRSGDPGTDLLGTLLSRLVEGDPPGPRDALRLLVSRARPNGKKDEPPILGDVLSRMAWQRSDYGVEAHHRTFQISTRLGQELVVETLGRMARDLKRGELAAVSRHVTEGAAGLLALAPHLAAFAIQHQDERFLDEIAARYPATLLLRRRTNRRVCIADGAESSFMDPRLPDDPRDGQGAPRGETILLRVVGASEKARAEPGVISLSALGVLDLGEEGARDLPVPSFLELVEVVERQGFAEVVVATPGPVGLMGWAAARLLGLRLVVVRWANLEVTTYEATGSRSLGGLARAYQSWLEDEADEVWADCCPCPCPPDGQMGGAQSRGAYRVG